MRDDLAFDWYSGAQDARRVSSILFEDHAFLDNAERARYRACAFKGHDGRCIVLNGRNRGGAVGVVDTITGRMVLECYGDPFRRGLEEVLAPVLAQRLETARDPKGHGRHVVERQKRFFEDGEDLILIDTGVRGRRQRRRDVCGMEVHARPEDNESASTLLSHLAAALDEWPFTWSGWKPSAHDLTTIRGLSRDLLPEHGDTLAGYLLFGR